MTRRILGKATPDGAGRGLRNGKDSSTRAIPPAARIDIFPHVAEVARLWAVLGKPNSGEFGYRSDLSANPATNPFLRLTRDVLATSALDCTFGESNGAACSKHAVFRTKATQC